MVMLLRPVQGVWHRRRGHARPPRTNGLRTRGVHSEQRAAHLWRGSARSIGVSTRQSHARLSHSGIACPASPPQWCSPASASRLVPFFKLALAAIIALSPISTPARETPSSRAPSADPTPRRRWASRAARLPRFRSERPPLQDCKATRGNSGEVPGTTGGAGWHTACSWMRQARR